MIAEWDMTFAGSQTATYPLQILDGVMFEKWEKGRFAH